MKIRILAALFVLSGSLLAACGTAAPSPAPVIVSTDPAIVAPTAAASQPAGPDGAALLQDRCTECHTLNRVTSAHKTADEWTTTVTRMVGKGAVLDASEQQTLIEYLAQTYTR